MNANEDKNSQIKLNEGRTLIFDHFTQCQQANVHFATDNLFWRKYGGGSAEWIQLT
jgi:hypothetical protein